MTLNPTVNDMHNNCNTNCMNSSKLCFKKMVVLSGYIFKAQKCELLIVNVCQNF